MAISNFYNINAHVVYPFVPKIREDAVEYFPDGSSDEYAVYTSPTELPNAAIVDVGFLIDTPFNPETNSIYLSEVYRISNMVYYVFRVNSATIESHETITFSRDITSDNFLTEWAVSQRIEEIACKRPTVRGFMVSGFMEILGEWLADNDDYVTFTVDDWQVEPARIQVLNKVNSINIANMGRVGVTSPVGCSWEETPLRTDRAYVVNTCMQGDITFTPGYNCDINQESRKNILTFEGVIGDGLGEPCEELPTYPRQKKVPGTNFYTGGQDCLELIKSINGQTNENFVITAGTGLAIQQHPTLSHTLLVSFDKGVAYNDCEVSLGDEVEYEVIPVSYYFDFGTADSPVTDGYIKIEVDHLYNEIDGYGWITAPDSMEYDEDNADPLTADYAKDTEEIIFRVDLPAGTYSISAHAGSYSIVGGTGTAINILSRSGYDEKVLGVSEDDFKFGRLTIMPTTLETATYLLIKFSAIESLPLAVNALEIISMN